MTTLYEIAGIVDGLSYRAEDSGYTVMRFRPHQQDFTRGSTVTVVGVINPEPFEDEELVITGEWTEHPKYGEQFKLAAVKGRKSPVTRAGLVAYLSSGKFPGVGPVTAERIIDYCGGPEQVADVFERSPAELASVQGITAEKATTLAEIWRDEQEARDTMTYLCGLGLTVNAAGRIWDAYGQRAVETVQSNPYVLAWDVEGIGFKRADEIARTVLSMTVDSPYRIEAGVLHALKEAAGNGHVYLPADELIRAAGELMALTDTGAIEAALKTMATRYDGAAVAREGDNVYLPAYHRAETNAARYITTLLEFEQSALDRRFNGHNRAELLREAAAALPFRLTDQQYRAVEAAIGAKVSVITGGPGTGKSTLLKMLVDVLDTVGAAFDLCAPTGRAAKRLGEATGKTAYTIHRLLGWKPQRGGGGGFTHDQYDPLDADFVVVDEVSMVDLHLMHALLRALRPQAHLLLVGDADQLPSVGAGDVLRDLITSGVVPVTRLDTIFRQGEKSKIITNAHAINAANMPDTSNDSDDFFFFNAETPTEIGDWIVDIVTTRLPEKFGFDPLRDIQVLSPMYRGDAGVDALNRRLQAALNPPAPDKAEHKAKFRLFREGDRVLQLKNAYDKGVFNGDTGLITAIHPNGLNLPDDTRVGPCIVVDMDGSEVYYEFRELDQLTLAYAITVHKSQGSEYPVVVMPVTTSHWIMLQRTLLYTGVTRGKTTVVLVGTRQAIGIAVRTNPADKRYSALADRLRAALAESEVAIA